MNELTAQQKQLVRASFESLGDYSDSVVKLFYGRLFEIAPHVRPLFRTDLGEQSRKLLNMLATIVEGIDDFEALRPRLEELGYRHIGYGAKVEDYESLRAALLWAMGAALDMEFDRATKRAWNELLTAVCGAMIAGAARVAVQK